MELLLLFCGPSLLVVMTCVATGFSWRERRPKIGEVLAIATSAAIAIYAMRTFIQYSIHPVPGNVPPWKDPFVLDAGLLFLLAPVGMLVVLIAKLRGAPSWQFWTLEFALGVLLLLGLMAGAAV